MALQIKLTKGLDLSLSGAPEQLPAGDRAVRSVALLGTDYVGLKPKMAVKVGDRVALGQTLFVDKRDPDVRFTAPGAGTVSAIHRGARRSLESVVIDIDDGADGRDRSTLVEPDAVRTDRQTVRSTLLGSGLWTAFRTRPFSCVPTSTSRPRSIFVTAIDTQPLAADPAAIVAAQSEAFTTGLDVVAQLTDGAVFLCTGPRWPDTYGAAQRVRHVEFIGSHPAGLAGTHIHHLDPVGADRTVWHVGYQDVIAIGKLFGQRRLSVERTISLGGDGFDRPRLVGARLGASVDDLVTGELVHDPAAGRAPRLISGSVLNGHTAAGPAAFLGRYHQQISAIPEGGERRLFGWSRARSKAPSFAGARRHLGSRGKPLAYTTALNGRPTASVPVDAFEHLIPLDILPIPLLRALLVGDTDRAQALGCLELDPEDLALCSFVCPGKNDYGAVLRTNLERIRRDG